ncbi:MAG: MBL fold metallo-hydrolase [Phycisphaerae bacterium]
MMSVSIHLSAVLSFVLAGMPALTQDRFAEVRIKATHVAGAVYMLEGAGGNIGVSVGADGVLIVDDQFAPLAERIRAAIETLEHGKGRLHFVLNTHWHPDHVGGNATFSREAHIIAHENVRKRLSTQQKIFERVIEPSPSVALPVITFDDTLSVHFNGERIRLVHVPHAHTDGDSVIWFPKSNVVHMGDLFFAGKFPFVDLGSGGDVEGLIRGVAQAMERLPAGVKVIPGHGPLSTPADLKTYQQMLIDSVKIVRERIAAGKTLDEIKAAGMPEKYADWGDGFIKTDAWLETVYNSLTRKP